MDGPSAISNGYVGDLIYSDLPVSFEYRHIAVFKYGSIAAFPTMLFYPRIVFIHTKKGDIAVEALSHIIYQVVVRIQYSKSIGVDRLRHDRFYLGHLFNTINSSQAYMIGANVGY